MATEAQSSESGADDEEHEEEMRNSVAQALVAMDLLNSYKCDTEDAQSVGNIVTNFTNWTFIKLEYPEHGGIPTVMRDDDTLVGDFFGPPSDEVFARIIGKIVKVCGLDELPVE